MTAPLVRVSDVFVAFDAGAGPVMALRGADLELAAGERLVVQGPNGSGKSTLLRVITGEQPVLAGTVEVAGADLHRLDDSGRRRWRARAIGFVDQHARRSLLPELSVLDNVALPLRLAGVGARPARQRAYATLARLQLEPLAARHVTELSGGEAQRVATCAAVAHDPALVLADEPTGELDEGAAHDVYALLGVIAATGAGVILVSHDPRSAAFGDRAVRIRDGRAAEQWTPGGGPVAQLPDSRGWIRVPAELLPGAGRLPALVVRTAGLGLALDPAPGSAARPPLPHVPALPIRPLAATASQGSPARLDGVSAGYGDRTLFADLDLELRSGTWTAVSGPSGSGKSTLLSLVAGLADPRSGAVSVGGRSWADLSRSARAARRREWLALTPQRASLVEPLTVRENLLLTLHSREAHPRADDDRELVGRVAEVLGLTRLLDQPVDTLSGGERQRTAVGRCLVSTVPLLVLDEPTSQADDASAARVVEALRTEVRAGRAVLVASHDPRLNAYADAEIALGPDQVG